MSRRTQFWMGFLLVLILVVSGVLYTVVEAGWAYASQLLSGVGIALFLSALFVTGIAMMVDAKVKK